MRRLWTSLGLSALAILAGLIILNPRLIAQANERIFGSPTSAGGGNAIALTATSDGYLNVLCPDCGGGGISGSIASGQVAVGSGADAIGGSPALLYGDDPSYPEFKLRSNAFSPAAISMPSIGGGSYIDMGGYGGTFAARTATTNGMGLGDIYWEGNPGTSDNRGGAKLLVWASQNWNDTENGVDIHWFANKNGEVEQPTEFLTFLGASGTTLGRTDMPTVVQGSTVTLTEAVLGNGKALKPDTTTAHTALLQAYDTDTGPGYVTFGTLMNGNAPSLTFAPPAGGGTMNFQGIYKSNDGTAGITGTCTIAGLLTITVKNGLITACS